MGGLARCQRSVLEGGAWGSLAAPVRTIAQSLDLGCMIECGWWGRVSPSLPCGRGALAWGRLTHGGESLPATSLWGAGRGVPSAVCPCILAVWNIPNPPGGKGGARATLA